MKQTTFIGVDPGRSGFGICLGFDKLDNCNCVFHCGKESQSRLLYPESLINYLIGVINDYTDFVICIEDAMTNPQRLQVMKSQSRDVGAIAYAMRQHPVFIASQGEWKCNLRDRHDVPIKGNMSENDYTEIMNRHFKTERPSHAWASYGLMMYAIDNYSED